MRVPHYSIEFYVKEWLKITNTCWFLLVNLSITLCVVGFYASLLIFLASLPPLFTIFNNPDWVCNFARLCISKSIDDYEMHFACT